MCRNLKVIKKTLNYFDLPENTINEYVVLDLAW